MGLIKKGTLQSEGIVYLKDEEVSLSDRSLRSYKPSPQVDISALQGQGAEMVTNARQQAQSLINKATSDAERIREEAKTSGIEDARREVEENASDKVVEAIETLNEAVKERKKIIKDAESEILRLAIKVAEQVIRSEVSLNKDVTLNIVSEAISRVSDKEQVIIKVNHDDIEYIKKYKDKIAQSTDGIKSLSVVEESSVEPGGCIVETNLGYIDAKISTKLKTIAEAFVKAE